MSRRTTAAAGRGASASPPATALSASACRRVIRRLERYRIVMVLEFAWSSAEQLMRIEFKLEVFPLIVMVGLKHGEGLAQQQRALGALGERRAQWRCGSLDQNRLMFQRAVRLEQDTKHDIDLGIGV